MLPVGREVGAPLGGMRGLGGAHSPEGLYLAPLFSQKTQRGPLLYSADFHPLGPEVGWGGVGWGEVGWGGVGWGGVLTNLKVCI